MLRVRILALLGAASACAGLLSTPIRAEQDPWTLLEGLRSNLATTGPYTAIFDQTYVPAGFDSGDQETGHLSIDMPTCLRWNYHEGKSFLICDGTVHQWNDCEPGGRIFEIDPASEVGLDLLLVDIDTLRQRYNAESEIAEGGPVITLSVPPEQGLFRAAIELDKAGGLVRAMEYTDDEGNRTRFEITEYTKLEHMGLFRPPSEIEWTEE